MPSLSDVIDKRELRSIDAVLIGYTITESTAPRIAQFVAREAFFGESILVRCTPQGTQGVPALPRRELAQLKKFMFTKLAGYQGNFETLWRKCMSIEQACK